MEERNNNKGFKRRLISWAIVLLGFLLAIAEAEALTLKVFATNWKALYAYKRPLEGNAACQANPWVSDPVTLALKSR